MAILDIYSPFSNKFFKSLTRGIPILETASTVNIWINLVRINLPMKDMVARFGPDHFWTWSPRSWPPCKSISKTQKQKQGDVRPLKIYLR